MIQEFKELRIIGGELYHHRPKDFDWGKKLSEEWSEMENALTVYLSNPTHDAKYLLLLEIADCVAVSAACSFAYQDSSLIDAITKIKGVIKISPRHLVNLVKAKLHLYSLRDLQLFVCNNSEVKYPIRKLANRDGSQSLNSGSYLSCDDYALAAVMLKLARREQLSSNELRLLRAVDYGEDSTIIEDMYALLYPKR